MNMGTVLGSALEGECERKPMSDNYGESQKSASSDRGHMCMEVQ